jgi:hypothetical protein
LHLRAQERPPPKVPIPQRERASDASKEAMIAALRERVKRLEEENRALRRQLADPVECRKRRFSAGAGHRMLAPTHSLAPDSVLSSGGKATVASRSCYPVFASN